MNILSVWQRAENDRLLARMKTLRREVPIASLRAPGVFSPSPIPPQAAPALGFGENLSENTRAYTHIEKKGARKRPAPEITTPQSLRIDERLVEPGTSAIIQIEAKDVGKNRREPRIKLCALTLAQDREITGDRVELRRSGIGKLVDAVRHVIAKPDYRVRAQASCHDSLDGNRPTSDGGLPRNARTRVPSMLQDCKWREQFW